MLAYIIGEITGIFENRIYIENNGIGYDVCVPNSVTNKYHSLNMNAKIYTYMYVREDMLCLYGFDSIEELEIFKMLINVNGIGPKNAISILSIMTVSDLKFAILSDDSKSISKANGVGAKTAVKVILELKDKVKLEDALEEKISSNTVDVNSEYSDAVLALTALGYSNSQVLKAISKIGSIEGLNSKQIIKSALKEINN